MGSREWGVESKEDIEAKKSKKVFFYLLPPLSILPHSPLLPTPYSLLPTPLPPMHVLSIPTWIIHVSSVIEWIAAIWLIWEYGLLTENRAWWGLSFAMLPALISAMCACTWHFFDNSPSLEWLVTLQASMTVLGNFTLLIAAYFIWRNSKIKDEKNSVNEELSRVE